MELNIIKTKNNMVQTTSHVLATEHEIHMAKICIHMELSKLKQMVISQNLPYEEIDENGFRCFISDPLQVIETENVIDITYEGKHVEFTFTPSCEATTASLAA